MSKLEYLQVLLEGEYQRGAVNGCSIRVIHNNEVIYKTEVGYANKEKGIIISDDTIFRMFSMTKPITAVATMILYERGQLQLLDPVSKYLEGFKNQKVWTNEGLVPVEREATIQDLLNMTSGTMYPDMSTPVGRETAILFGQVEKERSEGKRVDTVEFANRMGQLPIEFQPGHHWRYGTSADILGAVIEVVAKKSFGEFLEDEIFKPLNMKDTKFYVPHDKVERFAEIYEYNQEKGHLQPCIGNHLGLNDYLTPPQFESGGAGLVSTIVDYSQFALMLVNDGEYNGRRILSRKTMEYLRKPQLSGEKATYKDWPSMKGYDYGNLMRHFTDSAEGASIISDGTFGWDGWTGNYFCVDPVEQLIMIYMVQNTNGTNVDLFNRLQSVIYSSI